MKSNAKDVSTYIDEAPADRREALSKLRSLCLEVLTGFDEIMAYGGPCYARQGTIEVGFASQKHFIGLYVLRQDSLATQRPNLTGLSVGKGCIRYPRPDKIDYVVVEQLLIATRDSTGDIC